MTRQRKRKKMSTSSATPPLVTLGGGGGGGGDVMQQTQKTDLMACNQAIDNFVKGMLIRPSVRLAKDSTVPKEAKEPKPKRQKKTTDTKPTAATAIVCGKCKKVADLVTTGCENCVVKFCKACLNIDGLEDMVCCGCDRILCMLCFSHVWGHDEECADLELIADISNSHSEKDEGAEEEEEEEEEEAEFCVGCGKQETIAEGDYFMRSLCVYCHGIFCNTCIDDRGRARSCLHCRVRLCAHCHDDPGAHGKDCMERKRMNIADNLVCYKCDRLLSCHLTCVTCGRCHTKTGGGLILSKCPCCTDVFCDGCILGDGRLRQCTDCCLKTCGRCCNNPEFHAADCLEAKRIRKTRGRTMDADGKSLASECRVCNQPSDDLTPACIFCHKALCSDCLPKEDHRFKYPVETICMACNTTGKVYPPHCDLCYGLKSAGVKLMPSDCNLCRTGHFKKRYCHDCLTVFRSTPKCVECDSQTCYSCATERHRMGKSSLAHKKGCSKSYIIS